ncbi:MAG: hypothetical protein EOP43_02610 [Sphingobacteriaceae bacterium]|nr:MAG: hypothetical protein EOP43_02610 [Sphingobacteriaceae bacterium]
MDPANFTYFFYHHKLSINHFGINLKYTIAGVKEVYKIGRIHFKQDLILEQDLIILSIKPGYIYEITNHKVD